MYIYLYMYSPPVAAGAHAASMAAMRSGTVGVLGGGTTVISAGHALGVKGTFMPGVGGSSTKLAMAGSVAKVAMAA